jgi:hypothetical protein
MSPQLAPIQVNAPRVVSLPQKLRHHMLMLPPVSMAGCIRDHCEIVPCCGGARLLLETFSEKKFELPYGDQWTLLYIAEGNKVMSGASKHLVGLISSLWPSCTQTRGKDFMSNDAKALQKVRADLPFRPLDKMAWGRAWDSAVGGAEAV